MFVAPDTIKTPLAHILKKLDVHSRAELNAHTVRGEEIDRADLPTPPAPTTRAREITHARRYSPSRDRRTVSPRPPGGHRLTGS